MVSGASENHRNAMGRPHGKKFLRYLQKKKENSKRHGKDLATSSYSTQSLTTNTDSSKSNDDSEREMHSASFSSHGSQRLKEQKRLQLAEKNRNSMPSMRTSKVTKSDLSDEDGGIHAVPRYPRRENTRSQRKSYTAELAKPKRLQKKVESRDDVSATFTETGKRDDSISRDEAEHYKGRKIRDTFSARTKHHSREDYFDQLYSYKNAETKRGQQGSTNEKTETVSVSRRSQQKQLKDPTSQKSLTTKKKNKPSSRSHSSGLPRPSKSKSFREDHSGSRKRTTTDSRSGRKSRSGYSDQRSKGTSLWDKSLLQIIGESLFGGMEQIIGRIVREDLPFSVVHLDDEEECSAVTLDDELEY